jgi:hypothetical protein
MWCAEVGPSCQATAREFFALDSGHPIRKALIRGVDRFPARRFPGGTPGEPDVN